MTNTRAWIDTVEPDHWTGDLEPLRAASTDPHTGDVDNVLAVHSLHPAGLTAHLQVYRAAMHPTRGLGLLEREMVALVVSRLNGCHY